MPQPLEIYRAKRDFTKTREPSGAKRVAPSKRLRFVIQKHAATRLHYDLRLEYDGVFKSWAVTRGPSLDPHDRRLAVEVEDHPIDYGDFEGIIPKGQYGGGTVMLWDRGYWELEKGTSVEAALKKGHLSFRFDGKRLHGGWSLIRIRNDRNGGKRNNWLLIKHDDETAHPGDDDLLLEDNDTSVASGRSMEKIAEGKGRAPTPFITKAKGKAAAVWKSNRAEERDPEPPAKPLPKLVGAVAKAPKKVSHGKRTAMPDFVEPELTRLVDRPPSGDAWAHEVKFDGYRMQARVKGADCILRTRKGLDWTARFPEIAKACAALPDGLFDGEIVALDAQARPDFAGLQAALSSKKTGKLVFFLFDALFAEGEDLRALPLRDRKARLKQILDGVDDRLRYVDHFETGGDAVLKSACRMDLEGIVSKRLDSTYRSGRSDDWVKAKCRGGQEVVIAGWTSTGASFRSLIAGVYRDGELVDVGRVGTGFGRDVVDKLLPKLKKLEVKTSPFASKPTRKSGVTIHWVKPELVAEIAFAGWTGDGHIRQASFKGLREDKPAREICEEDPASVKSVETKSKAKKTSKAAPSAAVIAKSAGAGKPVVLGVSVSHPDKVLWPDADGGPVEKLELIQYIEAASPWLLPYVKGRPCSIIRTPDGIEGERFFQRHAGRGTSSLITFTKVEGEKEPYLQFDTAEALVAGSQSGASEFHPWNCLPGKPEVPGRFVFDLDPDEAMAFERVIDAAKEVRERLSDVGLTSFLKTTGGKGLHIVAPFTQGRSPIAWSEAKAFAREICARMAADAPDAYTVNMSKKVRGGRIFLDYLRNDRTSTAVGVLSPRARAGAPVSMPLDWKEAKKGLDPKAFTIRTAVARMKKRNPWEDWEDAATPLKDAITKLKKAG
ncbi:MAG TPA: DNA ligase D [Caulobacteraceae bacterium]|jgi:bifunctional non-homologous end joining protein LigD|nr:DNA ligase D [Caulobacteraceae bacterium]